MVKPQINKAELLALNDIYQAIKGSEFWLDSLQYKEQLSAYDLKYEAEMTNQIKNLKYKIAHELTPAQSCMYDYRQYIEQNWNQLTGSESNIESMYKESGKYELDEEPKWEWYHREYRLKNVVVSREEFMDAFRNDNWLNENLTVDDRIEIWQTVLVGSSDITYERLNSLLSDFGVNDIEVVQVEPSEFCEI